MENIYEVYKEHLSIISHIFCTLYTPQYLSFDNVNTVQLTKGEWIVAALLAELLTADLCFTVNICAVV